MTRLDPTNSTHAWSKWWFLHGGGIHGAWKQRQYSSIKTYALRLPQLAWMAGHSHAISQTEALLDAARELLRNYEKCNQYPENVTLHERQLGPLRVAVEALDRAKQEAEHAKP